MSPVTGRIIKNSTAFKIKTLSFTNTQIDFNEYKDLLTNKAVRFSQFCSTTIVTPIEENLNKEKRFRTVCCKAILEDVVHVC